MTNTTPCSGTVRRPRRPWPGRSGTGGAFTAAAGRRRRLRETEGQAPSEPDLNPVDAAWVVRVRNGDEDAACALVRRLYPVIIKSVRRHLPRRTSEEDMTQAVFATVFNKLGQFSGTVPLEHWVSRIAINTCLNQLRHELVRPELRMGDLSEQEEAVIYHLAAIHDEPAGERTQAARELLDRMLARLKPDERRAVTLLHLEERSTEEVSRLTGWSVPLVKVKAFRARHKMRRIWNTFLKAEES
jgi:RNA polymerase sigma-70 factor, ECF subfamily